MWRRPCLALNRELVLHSCPLIYVGRIKRHGLYRSAVAFLYSHGHSWGTAGWSRKRFTARTHTRVLKPLASAAATSSSFSPLPHSPLLLQPNDGESVTSQPIPRISQSAASYGLWWKCSAAAADQRNDNVDTTDTLWRLLVKSFNSQLLSK